MRRLLIVFCILIKSLILFSTATDQLQFAKKLFSDKLYDEAYLQIDQLISDYPNAPEINEAKLIIAQIYFAQESFQETRMQLISLLRNPFNLSYEIRVKAFYLLATVYYNEKNYQQAIDNYEKLFLDYKDSNEAVQSINPYLDCFYQLNDYQLMIVKSRDLQKLWDNDNIQAELLYIQAKAYFANNMPEQANNAIQDIRTKYTETESAWKAIELQILLIEKEKGEKIASEKLEEILSKPISRTMEEKLSWMQVKYYLKLNQNIKAKNKIDFMVNKFTLSENLNDYLLVWMQTMTLDKNPQPILEKEDLIINANKNKNTYLKAIYYLSKTHYLAQNYWKARNYLDEHITQIQTDSLLFDYKYLYAQIYSSQGQYKNSIETYNSLLNQFNHLGNNYKIFMQLGNIFLNQYNQETQALNYYRQATNIANNTNESSDALQKMATCYEILGQYNEALWALMQIPIEKIDNQRIKDNIMNKISLIQIFYLSETQQAFTNFMLRNYQTNNALQIIDFSTILAMDLKQFNEALKLIENLVTYDANIEKTKLHFLFAYKYLLEANDSNSKQSLNNATKEISGIGENINDEDKYLFSAFTKFINNKAKIEDNNLQDVINYVNSEPLNNSGINFRNFFNYQLWQYYNNEQNYDKMIEIALTIKKDTFVSDLDYQRVNIYLADYYYSQNNYQQAINFFNKTPRYLSLANVDYYYKYAMCLYKLDSKEKSLELLQKLVLNNAEHPSLNNARDMIVNYWIENNRYQDALDILNQIPPLLRTDADYRYFVNLYNKLNDSQKEKNALLYIQEKNIEELNRLAQLHLITNDVTMAEYTWNDVLKKNPPAKYKLNALANLANLKYTNEKYAESMLFYDQFFEILNNHHEEITLDFQPNTMAKEFIIASYLSNNRPKAESLIKSLKDYINKNDLLIAEIKLNEGIYYVNMDPKKANKPLTQVIEDGKIPAELAFKALFWRGVNYIQDNKDELAENDFLTALHTTNADLQNQIRLKLGTIYLNKNELDKALDYYYQVIINDKLGPLSKDAAHNFAVIARQMQDWEKVISAYRLIMDRWGQSHLDAETRLTIAFSYYQAKQYDQAINLFNQLLNELENEELKAESQYWVAECYVGKQALNEAVTAFLKVRYSYEKFGQWAGLAELRLAETYLKQGQTEKASQLFNEIIRVYGANSDLGKEARKYLEQ